MARTSVLLADSHPLILEAMVAAINSHDGLSVAGVVSDGVQLAAEPGRWSLMWS